MALNPKSYCAYVQDLPADHLHRKYHDSQYGFPLEDDNALFGRLILEINQAGLSWITILKKQDNFKAAFAGYDINTVAAFDEEDEARLRSDAGIIRNRLKIKAAIYNAQAIQKIQSEHGSFKQWLLEQGEQDIKAWVKLFKLHFKFTGPEIVNEFLMSSGFKEGAHDPECACYKLAQEEIKEHYGR
ncbi:DNA-3-methyladenine glycosylase I [Croceimicrobium sp.]|uniref:DNA-3-methyladenine glycosylase I n=1 Tax=Croceimicrobium sp. TaxID=2828340 RepID=UPI003BAC348C